MNILSALQYSERVGSGKRCKRLRRPVNELSRDVDWLVDVEVYSLTDAVDQTLPSINVPCISILKYHLNNE